MVFGEPGCAWADEVGELGGDAVENLHCDDDAVDPEVPCGHEAAEVSEGGAGPDVEAAFEWHDAVEADDGGGAGEIEERHSGDPGEGLSAAQSGGDSYP